jgi:hypothetical protein
MPSGGSTPIDSNDWDYVRKTYDVAVKHGLQYEWLQWFIGGIVNDEKSIVQAATDAAIEWDF